MINLDEPLITHVVTPRTILNEMMKNDRNMQTFRDMVEGVTMTVQYEGGSFPLTYDEVKDLLVIWRMRGKI